MRGPCVRMGAGWRGSSTASITMRTARCTPMQKPAVWATTISNFFSATLGFGLGHAPCPQ